MPHRGDALQSNVHPYHLWIVLTEPEESTGKFIFVNVTSYRAGGIKSTRHLKAMHFVESLKER